MDSVKVSPIARAVNVGLTSTQMVGPSDRRVGVIISAPPANRLTVNIGGEAVDLRGIVLYNNDQPLLLSDADFPGGLRQPIFGIMTVGAQDIGVIEFLRDP